MSNIQFGEAPAARTPDQGDREIIVILPEKRALVRAELIRRKVRKKPVLFLRAWFSTGEMKEVRSPLQQGAVRAIKVVGLVDGNGDGAADGVLLSGRKGGKMRKQSVSV